MVNMPEALSMVADSFIRGGGMVTAWVSGRVLVTPPPPQTGSGEGRDGQGRRGEV